MSSKEIRYFDYNATHPPFIDILQKNLSIYNQQYFNPSGAGRFSLSRQSAIEDVRQYLSTLTGKPKNSFVFCSTGTEANQLLIGSIVHSNLGKNGFYVSPYEHSSIYGSLELLGADFTVLKSLENGLLDLDDYEKKMKLFPKPTIVLLAGNETGVVQPYKEIGNICMSYEVPYLSDLMQAYCKVNIDYTYIDGFTFSGHKIGGGMGASVVCLPLKLKSNYRLFKGGNQENGNRAGTENTPAILSLKDASIFQFSSLNEKNNRLKNYKKILEENLKMLGASILCEDAERLPSTTFTLLPTDDIDFVLLGLEEKKIIVSTGSSCKSRAREASPSLLAMGYTKEKALRAIRISSGIFTDEDDINYLISNLQKIISLF